MTGSLALTLAALSLTTVRVGPAGAQAAPTSSVSPPKGPGRIEGGGAETPDQVARRYGLAGEVLVAKSDRVLLDKGYGTVDPKGGGRHRAGARWRLASITKQIVATILVRDAYAGLVPLDRPLGAFMEKPTLGDVTTRQLLQHHSGLSNPDSTPAGPDGVPAFYKATQPDGAFCLSVQASRSRQRLCL